MVEKLMVQKLDANARAQLITELPKWRDVEGHAGDPHLRH